MQIYPFPNLMFGGILTSWVAWFNAVV